MVGCAAGKDKKGQDYEGDRTLKGFKKFIKKNAKVSVTLWLCNQSPPAVSLGCVFFGCSASVDWLVCAVHLRTQEEAGEEGESRQVGTVIPAIDGYERAIGSAHVPTLM